MDEVEVRIAGVKVAGPIGVQKCETTQLNLAPKTFAGAVTVHLRELDSNSDHDNLGLRSVFDQPVTGVSMDFDAAQHAFYR